MDRTITLEIVLSHLIVSLIPFLISIFLGVSIGYFIARLIRNLIRTHPNVMPFLVLLPWRSIASWAALVTIYSPFVMFTWLFILHYGLGMVPIGISTGLVLLILIIPWSIDAFLKSAYQPDNIRKIFSIFRLSAILSLTIPTFSEIGMGYFVSRSNSSADFQNMKLGYGTVGVLMVVVDILLGFIQLIILGSKGKK